MSSSSIGIVAGVIVFNILLTIVFGLIGQELINAETGFNASSIPANTSFLDNVTQDDIGITDGPSFMKGFTFTISILPAWVDGLLLIPQVLLILGVIWWIRGT